MCVKKRRRQRLRGTNDHQHAEPAPSSVRTQKPSKGKKVFSPWSRMDQLPRFAKSRNRLECLGRDSKASLYVLGQASNRNIHKDRRYSTKGRALANWGIGDPNNASLVCH